MIPAGRLAHPRVLTHLMRTSREGSMGFGHRWVLVKFAHGALMRCLTGHSRRERWV